MGMWEYISRCQYLASCTKKHGNGVWWTMDLVPRQHENWSGKIFMFCVPNSRGFEFGW